MAMVTEEKKNIAARIGDGVGAAMGAVDMTQKWKNQKEQLEIQRTQLAQQKEAAKAQQEHMRVQQKTMKFEYARKLDEHVFKNPKNPAVFNEWAAANIENGTFQSIEDAQKTLDLDMENLSTYNQEVGILKKSAQKAMISGDYTTAVDQLQRINEINNSHTSKFVTPGASAVIATENQNNERRIQEMMGFIEKEKGKTPASGPEMPKYWEDLQGFAVKDLNEAEKTLPATEQRIDIARATFDMSKKGVSTGATWATPGAVTIDGIMAQFGNLDAQQREQLRANLNILGTSKILDFAKEAGVRSIDTPEEARRVMALAGIYTQSPETLQAFLAINMLADKSKIMDTKLKREFIMGGNDPATWESGIWKDKYAHVVDMETGDTQIVLKDAIPEGYETAETILNRVTDKYVDKEGNIINQKGAAPKSALTFNDEDEDELNAVLNGSGLPE